MCAYSWRVPLWVIGRLRVLVQGDLGGWEVQPAEIYYRWPLTYSLRTILPWLLLFASLWITSNRSWHAWLIWLPVLVVPGILFRTGVVFIMRLIIRPVYLQPAIRIITGLCWTVGFIGLLADKLGRIRGHLRILAIIGICILFVIIQVLQGQGQDARVQILGYLAGCGVIFLSVVTARLLTAGHLRPWRSFVALALGMVFWVAVATSLVLHLLGWAIFTRALLLVVISITVALLVVCLPFILLSVDRFWRKRWMGLLGLAPGE